MTKGLLTPKKVAALLGVSTRTLRRWVSSGRFPEPERFTRQTARWPAEVVERFAVGGRAAG